MTTRTGSMGMRLWVDHKDWEYGNEALGCKN